jgi:protein involved in polysaccharide export with SLBB domain
MRIPLVVLLLVGSAGLIFGQSANLRIGDPIEVKIGGVPQDEQLQVNNTYVVDSSGSINLPYINKVRAAGLTPGQLAREVEDAYRANKIYTNPNITVIMQPAARFVNVGGAVHQPSRVPFTEDMTLLTAINAAGGFNEFADQKRVRLLRGSEVKVFDVRQFRKNPGKDLALQPGDRVEVPQTLF